MAAPRRRGSTLMIMEGPLPGKYEWYWGEMGYLEIPTFEGFVQVSAAVSAMAAPRRRGSTLVIMEAPLPVENPTFEGFVQVSAAVSAMAGLRRRGSTLVIMEGSLPVEIPTFEGFVQVSEAVSAMAAHRRRGSTLVIMEGPLPGPHYAARPYQVYLISGIARWNCDRSSDAVFGGKGRHYMTYSAPLIDRLNSRCQQLFGETVEENFRGPTNVDSNELPH
ncbi:hypothetical protein NQZ68_001919 [Dissostichus eleginoides]|nr:hypothetical protein NQZ68_001919 [Dissostichus eleginoides]